MLKIEQSSAAPPLLKIISTLLAVNNEDVKLKLAENSVRSLTLRSIYVLTSFAISAILARSLGANEYGIYTYIYAIVTLLAVPAQFGIPTLLVRETASSLAKGEWRLINGIWRWAGKVSSGILGITIVIVVFVASISENWFTRESLSTLYWGIALIPLIVFGELLGAVLRGLNKVIHGQIPQQVLFPILYFLFILMSVLMFPFGNQTPSIAMSLQVFAAAVAVLFGAWYLLKLTPREILSSEPLYDSPRWFRSIFPLAILSGMAVINSRISILVLGFFVTPSEVGVYRVADQVATLVSICLLAINIAIGPVFAQLYAVRDNIRLQRVAILGARLTLIMTTPIVLILLIFGKPFLNLVFGAEFEQAFGSLAILVVGQLVNAFSGPVALLLNMTGHEQDTARVFGVVAIVNVVFNLLLIPVWGILGAALSSAISMVAWNSILIVVVHHRLRISSMAFSLTKLLRYSNKVELKN